MKSDRLLIVIPAYNEGENLRSVVAEWHKVAEMHGENSRLVIANDGSRDNTLSLLRELQSSYPLLEIIDKQNEGHGATLLRLYRHAVETGCDYVFQTDSDGQTDASEFEAFWADRAKYDLQIGERLKRGDGTMRKMVSMVLRIVVRAVLRVNAKDANTPYRLIKTPVLAECIDCIPEGFFLSNVAMVAAAKKRGKTVEWKPITFRERQGGSNSINIRRIIGIGIKAVKDFRVLNKQINKQ